VDFKGWAGIAGGIALGLLTAAFYFGRAVERDFVAGQGPVRDTVKVTDTLRLERVVPVIRRVETTRIETVLVQPGVPQYRARADTTLPNSIGVHITYNSPLPLSPLGFFSDMGVTLPDTLLKVQTVYITETKVIVEKELPWEWMVGLTAGGLVAGYYWGSR
jgi:hypothetical protein